MRLIAYVGRIVPSVSETFVAREIAALRKLGIPIKVFSVHPFDPKVVHPEAPELSSEVEVLTRPSDPHFWAAHAFFKFTHPVRYLRCLWDYVLSGEKSRHLRLRCFHFFLVAPYFAYLLQKCGATHVHAHFANVPTAVAMMAARLAGIPFSFTIHSRYEMIIDGILMNQKLAAAEFVVTISRFNIDTYLLPRFPAAEAAKIHVVRCGIDCDRYSPGPHLLKSPPIILSVGRLSDTKGFPTLISACRRLKDMGIEAKCVIIGDGPDRQSLLRQIQGEGISAHVTLAGELLADRVQSWFKRADLFVLPCCVSKTGPEKGNHDGIPYALIEAMAMGIPVVSTYIGGIPELIHNGETGLLVQPDEPDALAEAMAGIIQDGHLSKRLSEAGRDFVMREFNVSRSANQLFELFMKGRH
ncbi:MAG: glycosyltransferase family 4 protein [Syntrophobacteraceae bacterium]